MATMDSQIQDYIENLTAEIDEQITAIDNSKVMKAAAKLIEQKTKLMATRRALLGGNSLTGGSSGTRITQPDVVGAMTVGVGYTPAALAETLHTTESVVRGHLSRGKDERFFKKERNWYLRDPEAGMNGPDDVEEDE